MRSIVRIYLGIWAILWACVFIACDKNIITNQDLSSVSGHIEGLRPVYQAGELIEIVISTSGDGGCLLMTSSLQDELECFSIREPVFAYQLPKSIIQQAGQVHLSLFVSQQMVDYTTLYIESGDPHGRLYGYLGPKTVSADKNDEVQLAVFLEDRFNNLCEDGRAIEVRSSGPVISMDERILYSKNGFATGYFSPVRRAGEVLIGASSGHAAMRQKVITYTPGKADDIAIRSINHYGIADGQHYVKIKSEVIIDNFGNAVPDGTIIELRVEDEKGIKSIYQGITLGGAAEMTFLNPSRAGRLKIYATIPGIVRSRDLYLDFEEDISSIMAVFDKESELLTIGPVLGKLNSLVPDGLEATISYGSPTEKYLQKVMLLNGMATLGTAGWPGFLDSGACVIRISSAEKKLVW